MINRTDNSLLVTEIDTLQGIDPHQVTITISSSRNERIIVLAWRLKAKGGIGTVVAALIDGT